MPRPTTVPEAAAMVADLGAQRTPVRPRGSGNSLRYTRSPAAPRAQIASVFLRIVRNPISTISDVVPDFPFLDKDAFYRVPSLPGKDVFRRHPVLPGKDFFYRVPILSCQDVFFRVPVLLTAEKRKVD